MNCVCVCTCVRVCVGRSTFGLLTRIWARTQLNSLTFEHRNGYRLERYLGCRQEYVKRSAGLIKEIEIELQRLRHFVVVVVSFISFRPLCSYLLLPLWDDD